MLTLWLLIAPAIVLLSALFHQQYSLLFELLRISAGAVFFLLSAFGWGSLFRKAWHASFVLGTGILYAFCLLLAVIGAFHQVPLLCILAIGALLGALRFPSASLRFRFSSYLVYGIAVLAGARIVCAWTPLISYDSLVYQFYTPAEYLRHGGFLYLPWNVYTNSPMALQLTLGSSLALDASGQTFKMLITLFSFSMPISVAVFLFDWNRTAALLAALFTLVYPAFWTADTLGTIDLAVAGFIVIGVYYLRTEERLASGAAFGLALASRYQSIVIIVPALLFVLFEKRNWKAIGISLTLMVLFALPWILKNWIYTGNPFYPAFYATLGGADWSIDQARRLNFDVFGAPLSAFSGIQKWIAPFDLLLVQPYNALLGPVLLFCGFLAILAVARTSRPRTAGVTPAPLPYGVAAITGCAALIVWGILHPVADVRLFRFNAAGILFLMIATAGYCVEKWKQPGLIVALIAAVGSLPFGLSALLHVFPVYATVTDGEFRNNFQQANVPSWAVIEKANGMLNHNESKVLLLGETRGFLLRQSCVCPSPFNTPQIASLFEPSDSEMKWNENFQRNGITHVLISMKEWSRLQDMRVYGYMELPREKQVQILQWLQKQKILYEDHSGNALLEIKHDVR